MECTYKQKGLLWAFTGLKFWEVENPPPPSIKEATRLIADLIAWETAEKAKTENALTLKTAIISTIKHWFPDWTGESLNLADLTRRLFIMRKKKNGNGHYKNGNGYPKTKMEEKEEKKEKTEKMPEEPEEKEEKPEEKDSQKPLPPAQGKTVSVPIPKTNTIYTKTDTIYIDKILFKIKAGHKNIWLTGPAGCGKTTLCKIVAQKLDLPITILSCSLGTSPGEFTGFQFPTPRPSAISQALGNPGVIVLDEITMLSDDVAAVANALLANGEILSSVGPVVRHQNCIIIATSNTLGHGANRQYIGNHQLDAATLDRFTGGYINISYDREYEKTINEKVAKKIWQIREICEKHNIRAIFSTRAIIAGDIEVRAGNENWLAEIFANLPENDKNTILAELT